MLYHENKTTPAKPKTTMPRDATFLDLSRFRSLLVAVPKTLNGHPNSGIATA